MERPELPHKYDIEKYYSANMGIDNFNRIVDCVAYLFYQVESLQKQVNGLDAHLNQVIGELFKKDFERIAKKDPDQKWCDHITWSNEFSPTTGWYFGDVINGYSVRAHYKFCPTCAKPRPTSHPENDPIPEDMQFKKGKNWYEKIEPEKRSLQDVVVTVIEEAFQLVESVEFSIGEDQQLKMN